MAIRSMLDAPSELKSRVSAQGIAFSKKRIPSFNFGVGQGQGDSWEQYPEGQDVELSIYTPSSSASMAGGQDGPFPTVVWMHGGAMAMLDPSVSTYRTLGYLLASMGVLVVFPHFTNSVDAPFPRGLHDCLSAVHWVFHHQAELGASSQLVVVGDSGGGNLALATALLANKIGFDGIRGVYAMCPSIRGVYPAEDCPSHLEFDNYVLSVTSPLGLLPFKLYTTPLDEDTPSVEESEFTSLMWPSFASAEELRSLPPVVISVNELDPLRDEGLAFARRARKAGAHARAVIRVGTTHGGDMSVGLCDLAHATLADIAFFVKNT